MGLDRNDSAQQPTGAEETPVKAVRRDASIPVSVVIIAYNEEAAIVDCLRSVAQFNDIVVVVDSKSTDETARVAAEFGARVFVEDWKGDGFQKQSGIHKCENRWVLIIDADERLTPEAVEIIRGLHFDSSAVAAYSLRRRSYVGRRKIKHSGWWPDRVIRLFHKERCSIEGIVHAKLSVDGTTKNLDATLIHYSYVDYAHMISKLNKYSSWSACVMYEQGRPANSLSPLVHFAWMFFRTFVIRKGFLDGIDGLVISMVTASNSFFKYAKLLELRRREKPSSADR
jgi:glycosyltransferase involved in cell wall biosynthesis